MGLPLSIARLRVPGPSGRVLLSVDALDLPAGALVGVKGPSGAGKTTFLNALAGLAERIEGRVRWGDVELGSLGREARTRFRAAHVGMIFQDFLLFEELDAAGNAALSSMFRPRSERAAVTARAVAGLQRLGLRDTGRTVASFSGGERQRVGIARALAAAPDVVLADEPTASLHREAADALVADLAALARDGGTTLVAVSHDERLLAAMDRVLTIRDGQLLDGGTA